LKANKDRIMVDFDKSLYLKNITACSQEDIIKYFNSCLLKYTGQNDEHNIELSFLQKIYSHIINKDYSNVVEPPLTTSLVNPLLWACGSKKKKLIKMLVTNGANINCLSVNGNTPLLLSIKYDDYETSEYLLANGAATDKMDCAYYLKINSASLLKHYKDILIERAATKKILDTY